MLLALVEGPARMMVERCRSKLPGRAIWPRRAFNGSQYVIVGLIVSVLVLV